MEPMLPNALAQRLNRAKYDPTGIHCAAVNCGSPRLGFEISIGTDVLRQLGWKVGDRVVIEFNGDEVRVSKTDCLHSPTYRLLANGHKLRVRTTSYPRGAAFRTGQRKTPVEYRVLNGALALDLPEWF